MAMSCFLSRLSKSQTILRGQSLTAITNQLIRTSSILSNVHQQKIIDQNDLKGKVVCNKLLTPAIAVSTLNKSLNRVFSSTPRPDSDYKSHSHVGIWKLERLLAALLLPLIPAALMCPSQPLDALVAVILVMHTHWGMETIVVDYVRPSIFGPVPARIGIVLVYLFSIATLAGLLNLIYNDCGLANAVRAIWKIR